MKDASVSEHRYVIVFSHTRTPWCTRVQVHHCVVTSLCVIVSICKRLVFEAIKFESFFFLAFGFYLNHDDVYHLRTVDVFSEGHVCLQLIGVAQGCLDHTLQYVMERRQFGQSVWKFQVLVC